MYSEHQKRQIVSLIFLLSLLTASFWILPSIRAHVASASTDYTSLVDPFTGTGQQSDSIYHGGDTFPGADYPFGLVQWSPDTQQTYNGGYSYGDSSIQGFSLTHISGAGCNIYQDIPFMPYVGSVSTSTSPGSSWSSYKSSFSHANESASPGYYQVTLGNGVNTQLTVTQHTGLASFTYPASGTATLLLNTSGSSTGVTASQIAIGANTISGYATSGSFCGRSDTYTVYFWAEFSSNFASTGTWSGSTVTAGGTSSTGTSSGGYVTFNTSSTTTITARVGVSFVSTANAESNVTSEDASSDFATVHTSAKAAWNALLGEIQITGGTSTQQATFYTAMYHALLYPSVFSDANRQYIGTDGAVHTLASGQSAQYANFSGWDIYRSEIQLITLLDPKVASDIAQSMVNDYTQGGQFPKWMVANSESYVMIGDPADPIIAEIYAFGGTSFDTSTALTGLLKEATVANNVRPGLSWLESLGYLPTDGSSSSYGCCYINGTAATTLEYNADDFALSQFASVLGDTTDSATLLTRAQDWKNIWRGADHFLEPKKISGAFPLIYNPYSESSWVEGDGYQYTWLVPFNYATLINYMGGNSSANSRLDTLLSSLMGGQVLTNNAWLGNETTLETPWIYDYSGEPYKTQEVVRRAINDLWYTGSTGMPGNDDLGEMSSWYVWSALGMYPETPGTANLVLASPLFTSVTITRPGGQVIQINAPAAATSTYYVQSLLVNGATWSQPWIPASIITSGGTLTYTLGTTANTSWGSASTAVPPSYD